LLILAALLTTATAGAQEVSALTCDDFRPTPEALERFPNLAGACEAIIERDGELYGLFRADVRRVRGNNVTLHLPATGKTFVVRPDASHRVIADGQKTRARNLSRGQEIRIYLPVSEFAKPDVEEIRPRQAYGRRSRLQACSCWALVTCCVGVGCTPKCPSL
jgi:hypothetical protein